MKRKGVLKWLHRDLAIRLVVMASLLAALDQVFLAHTG